MYILYLDESGTHKHALYFVLAGLAIHESETFWLTRALDDLEREYFPDAAQPIEFHASKLHVAERHAKPPFDALSHDRRAELIDAIYQVIAGSHATLFAIVIEKKNAGETVYEDAFEQIVSKFDRMLRRPGATRMPNERGLVVIADSPYQTTITDRARRVWADGHRWGRLGAIADIPYFAPASNTRLLQLADFAANAVFRRYERGDARHFDPIAPRFDADGDNLYGLVHTASNRWSCFCPACYLWRLKNPRSGGATHMLREDEAETYGAESVAPNLRPQEC